jgi:glycosyltransferase involved in cell wall biosynthesis
MLKGYRWARDQRRLFPRYARTVVASEYMRAEMVRHGAPADRIEVLPLFSTVRGDSDASAAERDTVLFAGRMTTLKGGHVLVRAAARAAQLLGRRVNVIMAGDGPQKESWRQLAASLQVPCEMTGWLSLDDRSRVYARTTIAAMPSLWPEPFGLSGLDAAALGRPSIAFDVGGIREWLADGVNGRLVAPAEGDTGFARAIASLLDNPPECARLGQNALDVSRRMSLSAHVERLEAVLQRAAA